MAAARANWRQARRIEYNYEVAASEAKQCNAADEPRQLNIHRVAAAAAAAAAVCGATRRLAAHTNGSINLAEASAGAVAGAANGRPRRNEPPARFGRRTGRATAASAFNLSLAFLGPKSRCGVCASGKSPGDAPDSPSAANTPRPSTRHYPVRRFSFKFMRRRLVCNVILSLVYSAASAAHVDSSQIIERGAASNLQAARN